MSLLKHVKDVIQGKAEPGQHRSGKWRAVRAKHLEKFPKCAVCGGDKKLEVHHKVPFNLDCLKELDPSNLITLCESNKNGVNCHLLFGHLGNFKAVNINVEGDANYWSVKIQKRISL